MSLENGSVTDIMEWLHSSQPYDAYVYYTGYIARDRINKDNSERSSQIGQVAKLAMDLEEKRKVFLFQRKLGYMQYEYIAIKRKPSPFRVRQRT
jgi:hypothetical protein